jgi:hypothetical protein
MFRISNYNGVNIYFIVPNSDIFIEHGEMKLEKKNDNRCEFNNCDCNVTY